MERGGGVQGYALLLVTLLVFLVGHLWLKDHSGYLSRPWNLATLIAVFCTLLGFTLTRLVLTRSSYAYPIQPSPWGGFPVGSGKQAPGCLISRGESRRATPPRCGDLSNWKVAYYLSASRRSRERSRIYLILKGDAARYV